MFFAFCYPFSYVDCQKKLSSLSERLSCPCTLTPGRCADDQAIYFHREHLCRSLDGRRVDLLTVTSHHNMRAERERSFTGLFPDSACEPRPRLFDGKKVRALVCMCGGVCGYVWRYEVWGCTCVHVYACVLGMV